MTVSSTVTDLLSVSLFLSSSVWFFFLCKKHDKKSSAVKNVSGGTKDEIRKLREKYFSSKVSISYSNTGGLMIIGGSGSKLFDEKGKSYLDTRNNVCHVGHQHPKVIEAVQQQVAILNTNSRYLHPNIAFLAKRLVGLLPDPLEIIFFVNSGSEQMI